MKKNKLLLIILIIYILIINANAENKLSISSSNYCADNGYAKVLFDYKPHIIKNYYTKGLFEQNSLFDNIYTYTSAYRFLIKKDESTISGIIPDAAKKFLKVDAYIIDAENNKVITNDFGNYIIKFNWDYSKVAEVNKEFEISNDIKVIDELYNAKIPQLVIEFYENNYEILKEKNEMYIKGFHFYPEYIEVKYSNPIKVKKVVPIEIIDDLNKQKVDCENKIELDTSANKSTMIREGILNIIFFIGILFLLRYILFILVPKFFNKLKKTKDDIKDKIEMNRIRKIVEDEAIRESVKKTIVESSNDELEQIQKLINEAVKNGDTKTAQVLIQLLEQKKNK